MPASHNDHRFEPLPETAILGRVRGQWPVQFFSEPLHALQWVKDDPEVRLLTRVKLTPVANVEYTPPGEAKLVESPIPPRPVLRGPTE